jgi:organic radical activating enzyme
MDEIKLLKPVKEELDGIGCGMCLAKWTQVTIHLGPGITHSCHHVGAHKIPLDELKNNPSALHNTIEKKMRRKEMREGKRPKECDYCWRIEDNTQEYSDRVWKSAANWSQVDKELIFNSDPMDDIYPRYVEVSFSNVCNFKCSYCGPAFSSKWTEEVKAKGPYKLYQTHYNGIKQSEVSYPNREDNPYIEAFWKWFPEAAKHMYTFRITGGEPLLSKHTFKVIDYLLANPQPHLHFAINTNACPPGDLWETFVKKIKQLEENKSVKYFSLYSSAESFGEHAEYSRDGMDWELFSKNLRYFLDNTNTSELMLMSAVNMLGLPSLTTYLRFVSKLKKGNVDRIVADFAYVRHPEFLDIKIADKITIDKYLKPSIQYMISKKENFSEYEYIKLNRIYEDCVARFKKDIDVSKERLQFLQFIKEYDKRRGKNFAEVFTEYNNFVKVCEKRND